MYLKKIKESTNVQCFLVDTNRYPQFIINGMNIFVNQESLHRFLKRKTKKLCTQNFESHLI